jgi:hypothetical protein
VVVLREAEHHGGEGMIKHNWSPHGSEEAMRIQGKESNKDYH